MKYRASRDGFKASDFHSHCDGITNILTVIKATSGNIFGGFSEQKWHSRGGWAKDKNAFILSLVNKEEKQFRVFCSDGGKKAIRCNSRIGPCFGGDNDNIHDICIILDFSIDHDSYSSLGYSYQHPDYEKDTEKAENILAGSHFFETVVIEVYAKSN